MPDRLGNVLDVRATRPKVGGRRSVLRHVPADDTSRPLDGFVGPSAPGHDDQKSKMRGVPMEATLDVASGAGGKGAPSYVVAIGASAGGLEALQRFFSYMPVDSGMSFVVVQHLAPDFRSLMDELLERHTKMAVHQVENNVALEADSVYLIPPRQEMIVSNGKLLLRERDVSEGLSLPIDIFMRSLANEYGERAIGIIMSGTGSDGSRGVRAIHEAAGLVLCQTPDTARFDGMPNSAITTGIVDAVLAPEEMPKTLLSFVANSDEQRAEFRAKRLDVEQDVFAPVFSLLDDKLGLDFSFYKPGTINRRIERRMALVNCETIDEYVQLLRVGGAEVRELYRDLLIGVTEFFRDPEAWIALRENVIPQLADRLSTQKELRCWVPGTATGEEAYTLAILLHEWATEERKPANLRIFATDVHRESIDFAGAGVYPAAALAHVSEERRGRYFTLRDDGSYQVSSELRRMVVFANQNVLKDPPLTRLDLVCCRNLLIYFRSAAQRRALSVFHFGLKVGGFLFLGPSETLGDLAEEFEIVDRRWKMYSKRRDIRLAAAIRETDLVLGLPGRLEPAESPILRSTVGGRDMNLIRAYDSLLDEYVPPSLLVNRAGMLAHTIGEATAFLKPPTGRTSLEVSNLVHPDLRMVVITALQRALKESRPVSYGGIRVSDPGQDRIVRIAARPLVNGRNAEFFLVSFEEVRAAGEPRLSVVEGGPGEGGDVPFDAATATSEHLSELEQELRYTKEHLQATVEELETANEELQATNEELMAANEELQSTNEELHSVNEELYTVNREYEEKIEELTRLTDDMDNLLASTEIGTIFLDEHMRIRKFTPSAARQFTLLSQDIGRPISHLNRNIECDEFQDELKRVLATGEGREHEVRHRDGSWFLMRLHPYRNEKHDVTGIIVTFVDIHALKQASQEVEQRNENLQSFAYAVSHDLQEPARMMIGFSELFERQYQDLVDEKGRSYLEQIREGGRRLRTMLEATLQFSRVITQGAPFREVALSAVVEEVRKRLAEKIATAAATIEVGKLPAVYGDDRQITRLLRELVDNAVKFRGPRPPVVRVDAERIEGMWRVSVSDNGIGLRPEDRESIFQIFRKLNPRAPLEGVGIGLAIARRIVERHGGEISCKDSPDGGAAIVFTLPAMPGGVDVEG
ncbi:MAG: PAS domain-containing protein [Betaproteobacteria bacterium]|nr:PAS domain-containing protein [Betaproteobacteria bacterium]